MNSSITATVRHTELRSETITKKCQTYSKESKAVNSRKYSPRTARHSV
jgi:hypothetical protein